MIFLQLMGRCGNQLHQYTFAKNLSTQLNNEQIVVNTDELDSPNNKGDYWENSLIRFKINNCFFISTKHNIIYEYGSTSQVFIYRTYNVIMLLLKAIYGSNEKIPKKYYRLFFRLLSVFGIYYTALDFGSFSLSKYSNKFVCGYFEDIRWSEKIIDKLYQEFVPINQVSASNTNLLNVINTSQSVCISLRNWSLDVSDSKELQSRSVCSREYYLKSIAQIKANISNPVFIVFSDDIVWAKSIWEEFNIKEPTFYESGYDDVSEKIRLMSTCKHFILSNSTFCWWAYRLGSSSDSYVTYPHGWVRSGQCLFDNNNSRVKEI